ncbi:MAG: hypothetical protein ABL998_11705 [Planctomycetota bacterium]
MNLVRLASFPLTLAGAALLAEPPAAQGRKLNLPMPLGSVAGDVTAFELAPDGAHLAYLADQDFDEAFELYVVPVDGSSEAVKVSGAQPRGRIARFAFTPDGMHVLILADFLTPGIDELFSAPIDASVPPVRVSGTLAPGGEVTFFAVSPDSARVVYVANAEAGGGRDPYSAPVAGGAQPIRLIELGAGGDVLAEPAGKPGLQFTDDGHVLFLADRDVPGIDPYLLYSAPLDGSAPASVRNGPLVAGGSVKSFAVVSDGERVVYVADQNRLFVQEVFSARTDGSSSPQRLNLPVPPAVTSLSIDFELSADGSRVVFDASNLLIYTVPADGSAAALRLNDVNQTGASVASYAISGDGTRVLFTARDASSRLGLYSVPIDASTLPIRLHGPLAADISSTFALAGNHVAFRSSNQLFGADIDVANAASLLATPNLLDEVSLSFDGQYVLYRGLVTGFTGLHAVPWDGSVSPFRLDSRSAATITRPRASPVEARAFFLSEADTVVELYTTPIAPDQPDTRLNGSLQREIAGDVYDFSASADGRTAIYHADQEVNEQLDLYGVRSDGTRLPIQLNASGSGNVQTFVVDPLGDTVLMVVGNNRQQLQAARASGGAPLVLTPGLPSFASIGETRVVPGGELALYVADQERDEFRELYVVPTDASAAPRKLSGPILGPIYPPYFYYRGVRGLEPSPDRTRVVYRADQDSQSTELYSVPLDGSAPAVRISPPAVTPRSTQYFLISPDSNRVALLSSVGNFGGYVVSDLFSTPIDASGPAVQLNPPLVPGGSVGRPLFTPDSTRIVYIADQEVAGRYELYSVPSDGSSTPIQLNPPLGSGMRVLSTFALTADGNTVVFAAQTDADSGAELYSVPLEGGAATLLFDPTAYNGVIEFVLTPDSRHVVCRAEEDATFVIELFLVPLDGSAAPARLLPPFPPSADVAHGLRLSRDGRDVVYIADAYTDEVQELFAVPVTGGTPKRLSGSLVHEGDVLDFRLGHGGVVLYRADQDTNGVIELYTSFLTRPHRAR